MGDAHGFHETLVDAVVGRGDVFEIAEEAAARQLLRERRLEAWVTEIGASSRPEDGPA